MENYQYQNQPSDIFTREPVVYGTFWERFGAVFIDGLIFLIPNLVVRFAGVPALNVLVLVAQWLYFALMESGPNQATLGRKAMGLKVTTVDGGRLTFGQATGRYFGKIVSTIILFIGYFMMLWDDRKQTLHDKMAGTLVVHR